LHCLVEPLGLFLDLGSESEVRADRPQAEAVWQLIAPNLDVLRQRLERALRDHDLTAAVVDEDRGRSTTSACDEL